MWLWLLVAEYVHRGSIRLTFHIGKMQTEVKETRGDQLFSPFCNMQKERDHLAYFPGKCRKKRGLAFLTFLEYVEGREGQPFLAFCNCVTCGRKKESFHFLSFWNMGKKRRPHFCISQCCCFRELWCCRFCILCKTSKLAAFSPSVHQSFISWCSFRGILMFLCALDGVL